MQVDNTTLTDLSIFHNDEEQSVFHHLNFAHTNGGREYFRLILSNPLDSIGAIQDSQATIKALMQMQEKLRHILIAQLGKLPNQKLHLPRVFQTPNQKFLRW